MLQLKKNNRKEGRKEGKKKEKSREEKIDYYAMTWSTGLGRKSGAQLGAYFKGRHGVAAERMSLGFILEEKYTFGNHCCKDDP